MKKIEHFHLAVPVQMFIYPESFNNNMLDLDLPWFWVDINLISDYEIINYYRSNIYEFVSLDYLLHNTNLLHNANYALAKNLKLYASIEQLIVEHDLRYPEIPMFKPVKLKQFRRFLYSNDNWTGYFNLSFSDVKNELVRC